MQPIRLPKCDKWKYNKLNESNNYPEIITKHKTEIFVNMKTILLNPKAFNTILQTAKLYIKA